jgi:hypothetical protein
MTGNFEATEPEKVEEEEGKQGEPGSDDNSLAKMIESEQRLARKMELMCQLSGERPVDVQAMYIHKLQAQLYLNPKP